MTNDAISLHKKLRGKIFVGSKICCLKLSDIELIYTPGVASVSKEIFHNPDLDDKRLQKRIINSLKKKQIKN